MYVCNISIYSKTCVIRPPVIPDESGLIDKKMLFPDRQKKRSCFKPKWSLVTGWSVQTGGL